MDSTLCAQCGIEIEGMGIQFRGRTFCGDECCEQFDADYATRSEPELDELTDEDLPGEDHDTEDGLGYRDDDDGHIDKEFDDDDYAIEPDDF